jgi:hypothetical protein
MLSGIHNTVAFHKFILKLSVITNPFLAGWGKVSWFSAFSAAAFFPAPEVPGAIAAIAFDSF